MTELNWKEICLRLKDLRIKNKLTIERLSEIIGVSISFIGLVERGDSGISIDNLFKLSQVFNVSVDYILTGKDNRVAVNNYSSFDKLNTAIFDYSDEEIAFLIELTKFLRPRIQVK